MEEGFVKYIRNADHFEGPSNMIRSADKFNPSYDSNIKTMDEMDREQRSPLIELSKQDSILNPELVVISRKIKSEQTIY